jgi:hypothetical protein
LDDEQVFLKIYSDRIKVAEKGFEVLGGRIKRKCSIFNVQNMVTEQTMVAMRINFIRNYMAQVVKVMFSKFVDITYKFHASTLMTEFFFQ